MFTRGIGRWNDFDEMFSAMNYLKAHLDRVFDEAATGRPWDERGLPSFAGTWPRANLIDSGTSLTLIAEVPGLSEKDIKVTLNQEVLTIAGERKTEVPEGYSTHRQERPSIRFSRSISLPSRIDPERVVASVKNGMLSIEMQKPAEVQPRQITIKAS